jgi:VWFA-related protein
MLLLAQTPPAQPPAAPPSAQSPQPPSAQSAPAPAVAAQQPPPLTGQQPPVFRVGTANVRVDVTVIDHKGNPVTDLTKDDFEVREDGALQTVDTIKMIHATGEAPDDDISLPIRSPEHAAVEAARDDIRVFVIFWDEYHIGQFVPAIRARDALNEFVQTAFGPTDLVALMDQLTPTDAIRFTRDRRALAEQVHKLQGRQGVYLPPRSSVEEAQLYQMRDVERLRSQVTATALESTIAFLGQIKEGRKAIVFVSQSIGRLGGPTDAYTWLDGVVRLANANNTTIYSFDPRGLDMNLRPSDILQSLAENTGGRQFASNAPAAQLRAVVSEASAYYLLGYRSEKNPSDGKFHKIAVHVKRPGLDVKARTGYYAPSPVEMDTAKKKAAENEAPPEIEKALSTLVDAPHVSVPGDFWAGATRGPDGKPRVTAVWTPREGENAAGVSLRATTDNGQVLFDGPLSSGTVTFEAAPGTVHLRRSLNDAGGSLAGRQDLTLDVPDFSTSPLTIATPVLYRAHTPIELRAIQGTSAPAPFAGRQFDRTDRVIVRFDVFGAAAADATVTVTLLSRLGAKLAAMPLRKAPDGPYEIDLPIASVGRGEYVFEFDASHGADQAKALLSFKVN